MHYLYISRITNTAWASVLGWLGIVILCLVVTSCSQPQGQVEVMPHQTSQESDIAVPSQEEPEPGEVYASASPGSDFVDSDAMCKPAGFPTRFDDIIEEAHKKHMPNALLGRPCLLRAQLAKESSLRPDADSGHAIGLGQQIPEVADECRSAGLIGTRTDPQFSAFCAAWKDKRNWEFWTANRTEQCRVGLMLGSYVSGAGHLLKGQKEAAKEGVYAKCVSEIAMYMTIHADNVATMQEYVSTIRKLENEMVK